MYKLPTRREVVTGIHDCSVSSWMTFGLLVSLFLSGLLRYDSIQTAPWEPPDAVLQGVPWLESFDVFNLIPHLGTITWVAISSPKTSRNFYHNRAITSGVIVLVSLLVGNNTTSQVYLSKPLLLQVVLFLFIPASDLSVRYTSTLVQFPGGFSADTLHGWGFEWPGRSVTI